MKAYLLGSAIAALSLATAVAAAQPAPPPGVAQGTAPAPMAARPPLPAVAPLPPMVAPPMMMHSDHVMTREEVAEHVGKLFAKLDTNHDGFITRQEVEAFHQKLAGMAEMGHDMAEHGRGMAEMGRAMAEPYSDRDMQMPDRGAMFDRLDTNHDGNISRQEFLAGKPEMRERRVMIMRGGADGAAGAPMPPMDGHPGMNMDMHMRHMGGMGMGMAGFGGRLFEMADVNHDGKVSLAEAQAAALAHFDKADLNHDGKITPDERQQMHQTVRIERREG